MSGLTSNKIMTHKAKDYAYFYDDDGLATCKIEGIVETAGGASAGGGGSIVYTNSAGDFIATVNDATKTITVTGLPFTLEAANLVNGSIVKIDSTGAVTSLSYDTISVSGGVITLTGDGVDNFSSTDEVVISMIGPDKWYDQSQDSAKSLVQNPEWAHYTDIEHIVDSTDATVDQHYSPEIFMAGYQNLAMQFTAASDGSGVTFKVYGTLNDSAATPADGDGTPSTDWVDLSSTVIGGASTTIDSGNSEIYFDVAHMVYKYIIQYEPDNATNTTDIFIRRY